MDIKTMTVLGKKKADIIADALSYKWGAVTQTYFKWLPIVRITFYKP